MSVHHLKIWPEPFKSTLIGTKTAEYRHDDRGFEVGDLLVLWEWSPIGNRPNPPGDYTGRRQTVRVQHIARGPDWGIPTGDVVLSHRPARPQPDEEVAAAARNVP